MASSYHISLEKDTAVATQYIHIASKMRIQLKFARKIISEDHPFYVKGFF